MDQIQKILIKAGRKDLAQEYFEKLAERNNATFKCTECGTKVLDNTSYCVKCEKKVENPKAKEAAKKRDKISIPITTEDLVKSGEISRIILDLSDIATILEKKFKGKSRKTEIQSGSANKIIFDLEK